VLETLLEGVAENHASAVILDITGVQVVDTQVANAILRAAQAVKLLGAQVIITGIRPEVAQTLVTLGADLSSIITRSTLQSGIAYALR
jgi:rsbT co-antagonist protein RsbR